MFEIEKFKVIHNVNNAFSDIKIGDTVKSINGNLITVTQILKVTIENEKIHIQGLGIELQ